MNALGAILWEGAVHATCLALLGTMVYLLLRRRSPAAGSLVAISTLISMAMLAVLAFCPWPRWGPSLSLERLREAVAASDQPEGPSTGAGPAVTSRQELRDSSRPVAQGEESRAEKPTMALALLQALARQWGQPAPSPSDGRWSWREWLTFALLGTMVLGLVRLGAGFWAMLRLRSRSKPVADLSLFDTLEILRAEMGCLKSVAVHSSEDLTTPATIGWRRILIILPVDWPTWDDDERRAVLAHELAHVCRGDFFMGLLAQLSVALQFYHPLAHWLSARLRLEQELAADAWSARLSGGTLPYLATLARMALRRDERALSWPARAFLPSRGTFVRRIEMLRHSRPIRHVWLSRPKSFLTIACFAAIGILIAGMREPISPSFVQAQAQVHRAVFGAGGAESGSFDLAYLPAETRILIACRPASVLGRPDLAPAQALLKDLPLPAQEIEQLLIFWEGSPEAPAQPGTSPILAQPSGIIIRSAKPQDWKVALGRFIPGAEEVAHAGLSYLRPAPAQSGRTIMSAFFLDDRTAVCAREDLLRTMMEDRKDPPSHHAWDDAWNQAAKGDVGVAIDTRWLRRRLNQANLGGGGNAGDVKLDAVSPLLEKVRAYAAGIKLDGELAGDVVASVNAAEDVKSVTETAQALLTLGRNSIPALKEQGRDDRGPFREANQWFFGIITTLLEKARLETAGQTVHLRSSCPIDVAQTSRTLGSFVQVAAAQSQRQIAVNNLKQIGLAFHNYADVHGHFPTPVLYGGKTGKVPYSWRVAILPFLEQSELYNSYNFDEPWDGPNNRKLLDRMPSIYGYPGMGGTNPTHTTFFVFTGPDTMLGKGDKPFVADVTDGTSNTLLAVEAKREIPWTKPEDIPFDPQGPLPELGGFSPDGFNALFGDGSVRFIKNTAAPAVLKALITRAGGEVISSDSY
jgi:hypothetical protein